MDFSRDAAFALVTAVVASAFALELMISWRKRRRLHAEVWSMAFGAYALGAWALVAGLSLGWTSLSFRSFYFFGAIANIPLLAAGSIALVVSERAARRFLTPTMLWVVFGFFATFLAPFVDELPTDGIPDGSEVFGFTFAIEVLTFPGPRLFAAVSGAVGSLVIIGLSLVTVVRSIRRNRRLAFANILIIAGVIIPAVGGTLTALGESAALSLSLMVGISLLWLGYRLAVSAKETGHLRSRVATVAGPGSVKEPSAKEEPDPDDSMLWEISVRSLEDDSR